MGYTFTFGDIERICRSLGWAPVPGRRIWRHIRPDGVIVQLSLHSHGSGAELATGTAKAMARQLGFSTLEEMAEYLKKSAGATSAKAHVIDGRIRHCS